MSRLSYCNCQLIGNALFESFSSRISSSTLRAGALDEPGVVILTGFRFCAFNLQSARSSLSQVQKWLQFCREGSVDSFLDPLLIFWFCYYLGNNLFCPSFLSPYYLFKSLSQITGFRHPSHPNKFWHSRLQRYMVRGFSFLGVHDSE